MGKGNDGFGFAQYFCSYFEVIFTCHKNLQLEAPGFTSPPKEGVLLILKIHHLGRV
jgi:hypothetical protein